MNVAMPKEWNKLKIIKTSIVPYEIYSNYFFLDEGKKYILVLRKSLQGLKKG
jgi:hypothetical protein